MATGSGTIARFTRTGELLGEWEPKAGGKFHSAVGIAVDASGLVYVTEYWGYRVRVFKEDGEFVRGWGVKGSGPGQFDGPSGIAIGNDGLVYIADRGNRRIQVFSPNGHYRSAWRGRSGGQLDDPVAVAVDGHRIYVGDGSAGSIKIFTTEGQFLTKWGPSAMRAPPMRVIGSHTDGAGVTASIGVPVPFTPDLIESLCDSTVNKPWGITLDRSGNVYALNGDCHRVQKFTSRGRYLGGWWIGRPPSHVGESAAGLAIGPDGEVYVADYDGHVWAFGYGPTHDEQLLSRVMPGLLRVVSTLGSMPIGQPSPQAARTRLEEGDLEIERGVIGFGREPILQSVVWSRPIPGKDDREKSRVEKAVQRVLLPWQDRVDGGISSSIHQDTDGTHILRLVRTNTSLQAAPSNPDTCDLRVLEGGLQEPAAVWGALVPALQERWPHMAGSLANEPTLSSVLGTVRAAARPGVSESDRDLAFLAADQWLRSRTNPAEALGEEWSRLGFRGVSYEYPGSIYCGSVLPFIASRAGGGNEWADRALVVLLDQGWCTDCSEVFEGAHFGNEIFVPILKHGEEFLKAHPRSRVWPSVALRVAMAHETAWSLGLEAPPDDFPDYKTGSAEHGRRALELYRQLLPRTQDTRLIRALRRKIRSLQQGRDTKCQVYYLTGQC